MIARPSNIRLLTAFFLCVTGSPLAVASGAGDDATIIFRKVFQSSYPEFVEIKLTKSGSGTCDIRQLDEEPNVRPLEVGATIVQRIFELAGNLHNFRGVDLDVHRRLANLGKKTFRYEKGGEVHEVTFNYTLNESASELVNIFEGIEREESDLADLERTMRYDRLGVNDVMRQIEADYNHKLLPEPERLLPKLDQLAANERFLDMARDRARALANRIRSSQ
jgi:hypothetical protein